ncbi:MAG: YesL family protein [Lachnospiraceae bacterium]|nr:YesL family protein [Lachnospiraceae bacterium]
MRGFFNLDGPLFSFFSRIADLAILNILFLICSLPIVTIGASLTAMSYVTLKMKDGVEGYVWKSFLKSFRQNLRQATIIWIGMLLLLGLLGADFLILRTMSGALRSVLFAVVLIGFLLWLLLLLYVFPILSRFDNTIPNTLRNALLIALANAPRALLMVFILIAAFLVTFWNAMTIAGGIMIWLILGFALLSWINSTLQIPIFHKLMPEEEDESTSEYEITTPEESTDATASKDEE